MIKALIGKVFAKAGYRIVKKETKEDMAFAHQKKLLGGNSKKVIFDVGAYVGETALKYNDLFDGNCAIHAFEPFFETFDRLQENVKPHPNITSFKLALSNLNGTTTFYSNKFSATNSLLPSSPKGSETWGSDILETKEKIEVPVQRLDDFVQEHKVQKIDILKMDTQGSEYMVLEGAKKSLKQGLIKLIYCEINVMPSYEGQKHYDEMLKIIRAYGFVTFNLIPSFNASGQLRYMDAIFMHENQVTQNNQAQ